MENWKWLEDKVWHWKSHLASADLIMDVEADLAARSVDGEASIFTTQTRTDPIFIDLPGMILADRSHRTVEVDGLKVTVPSQDWASILADLKLLQPRTFKSGTEYYKLHNRFFCLVLTPAQRKTLIEGMETQAAEAEKEAEKDNGRFLQAYQKVNEDKVVVISQRAEALAALEKDGKARSN